MKDKTELQLVAQFKANHLLQTYPKMSMETALAIVSMRLYHEKMNALHTVLSKDLEEYFGKNYNMSNEENSLTNEYLKEHYS